MSTKATTGTAAYTIGRVIKGSKVAGYCVASRATGKQIDHRIFATEAEAQAEAEQTQASLDARKAAKATSAPTATATKVEAAIAATSPTEAQIAYALTLAAKNAPGSIDLTAAYLRTLSRNEVSRIIDSLKAEW